MATQVRLLTLVEGQDYRHLLFRIKKGWVVRFSLGTSFWYRNVELFCNYPLPNEKFSRNAYQRYDFRNADTSCKDMADVYADIKTSIAGVFQFYVVTLVNGERHDVCKGSFLVDPHLTTPGGELSMDNIIMQTVLCKLLGPFSDWKKQLSLARSSGYNCLHFSPMQELGKSNSAYSIRDHHKLSAKFSTGGKVFDLCLLENFIKEIYNEWGMISVVDVVWNHAARDSDWLRNHPDATYNLKNTLHMRPAFLVDRALWYVNCGIMNGKYVEKGITGVISKESEVGNLAILLREAVDRVHLQEFFILDINILVEQLRNMISTSDFQNDKSTMKQSKFFDTLKIIQDDEYKRFGCTVDMKFAVKVCTLLWDSSLPAEENIDKCCHIFRECLDKLNDAKQMFVGNIIEKVVGNTIGHVRYHFVDNAGPRYGKVTKTHSICTRYFSHPFADASYKDDTLLMDSDDASYIQAVNGWVMGYDVLKNFADSDSMVYLNRELVAWGDSIKLKYGAGSKDSPFLYSYMRKYTEQLARIFHGFRIDNCHGTPIHAAEYLIDCAREIRPDLYVVAELFTNDEATDNTFINRLGINSMIRESLGAHSSRDLGRHVHRYGGDPVGMFIHPPVRPIQPSMSHAIFMDLTHDNPSLFEARTVFDILPSSALVLATSCGIGSTRGYDELVPHHINVVTEARVFSSFSDDMSHLTRGVVTVNHGIIRAKKALNNLHTILNKEGFSQIYVDQMTEEICSVTRHSPTTHESVIIVSHNAFATPDPACYPSVKNNKRICNYVPPIKIPGVLHEVVLEACLFEIDSEYIFRKDNEYINGSSNYRLEMQEHISIGQSNVCGLNNDGSEIKFTDFVPGTVIAFKIVLHPIMKRAVRTLGHVLAMFPSLAYKFDAVLDEVFDIPSFSIIIKDLSLVDLNRVLYRCHNEEDYEGWGGGAYDIPGYGYLVYCGLQGLMSVLSDIRMNNNLGHPLCNNLREGNWMLDYIVNRLKRHTGTLSFALWLESVFANIKELPRYLIPCYFDAIITCVYKECLERTFSIMCRYVQEGSTFFKHLALGSLQMIGYSTDSLPAVCTKDEGAAQSMVSMAAGLPHFSISYMRCWGRDTFISLRGLLLITGRFDTARELILAFGGCIRHGLIPNLLAGGVGARYNSRDATWFWLQSVQHYCKMSKEGTSFLNASVRRMYPDDFSEPQIDNAQEQPLQDIIQEILQRHFQGISFRERKAGLNLDRHMSSEGFNNSAGVDMQTGFIYGGSEHNCGTWMDKMGSSIKGGNFGKPATPRDGSAVELVGLCKSTVTWLIEMNKKREYQYDSVTKKDDQGNDVTWSFKEWNDRIQKNFEEKFYIGKDADGDMVNKREIYKDSYKSTAKFTDYQLRPNFPIAMCVAPEMFVSEHALTAISKIEQYLLGPIGLATLEPGDWMYNGVYENSLDTDQFNNARGFNYHQGPEWTWVLGPFLQAKIYFSQLLQTKQEFLSTLIKVKRMLLAHYDLLMSSPWKGLPELTNKGGAYCYDSCPTQAWSIACLLEVLYYIEQCETK